MAFILPGYEYDIFISYRHNDNLDGWVTDFVQSLEKELKATLKGNLSIYFDKNPRDGLLETHNVDKSLEGKLKCLILIPIISQTYCDPKSFAWEHEFRAFNKLSNQDQLGRDIKLSNGNVASRILPVKIHDLDPGDQATIESEIGGVLRAVEFIFKSPGVNRPLRNIEDHPQDNLNKTFYRDQINKVANAVKNLTEGIKILNGEAREGAPRHYFAQQIVKQDLMKVGLVYSIAALVIWKIVTLVVDLLSFSTKISMIAATLLVALFPVAIYLAWKFENSPEGFIRSSSAKAGINPFPDQKKKPLTSNTSILALLVVMLILYFVPQHYSLNKAGSLDSFNNKSIAVLYFDNMSKDDSDDYMSDGLTEEIITRLTKIDGLKVISRTSVKVYKGQSINLKKIARDLNVAAVLEGSVRKSGNQLKVTAQLINAETDEHLWAESFDRELSDIFKVQTEIAEAIADKFKIEITSEMKVKVSQIATPNTEAYDYYLKARYIAFHDFYYKGDSNVFVKSKTMYERAIQLDPKFALAFAGLADLYDAVRIDNRFFTPEMDSLRHALVKKAYQLDPNSAFVNNVRMWMFVNRDWEKIQIDSAFQAGVRALQLDPNDYYNYSSLAGIISGYGVGLYDQAIPLLEKAIELNPLDPMVHVDLGNCYLHNRNKEAADHEFEVAYSLAPGEQYLGVQDVMGWLIDQNRIQEAIAMRQNLMAKYGNNTYDFTHFRILLAQGKKAEALKVVEKAWGWKGFYYAWLSDHEKTIKALWEIDKRNRNDYLILQNMPLLNQFKNNPEFQKILARNKARHEEKSRKYSVQLEDILGLRD